MCGSCAIVCGTGFESFVLHFCARIVRGNGCVSLISVRNPRGRFFLTEDEGAAVRNKTNWHNGGDGR